MFVKMLKKSGKILFATVLFSFLLWPFWSAQAVSTYVSANSQQIGLGDTVIVSFFVDAEDKEINVVEGSIRIANSHKIIIKDFSLANSAFSYWPRRPSWSPTDQVITFVAGVPGGVKAKALPLFKVVVAGQEAGQVSFVPEDFQAYANDGEGTKVTVAINTLTLDVSNISSEIPKDEWAELVSGDNKPPYNITVDLGQDEAILSGQKFISFSAKDDESGIAYYEIKEGDRPAVRAGSPYVLQNQETLEPMVIIAYDKAGNASQLAFDPNDLYKVQANYWIWSIYLVALLLVLFFIYWFIYRKFIKKTKTQ